MIAVAARFIAPESAGGVVLALAMVSTLIIKSRLGGWYQRFAALRGAVRIANDRLVRSKPLLLG